MGSRLSWIDATFQETLTRYPRTPKHPRVFPPSVPQTMIFQAKHAEISIAYPYSHLLDWGNLISIFRMSGYGMQSTSTIHCKCACYHGLGWGNRAGNSFV